MVPRATRTTSPRRTPRARAWPTASQTRWPTRASRPSRCSTSTRMAPPRRSTTSSRRSPTSASSATTRPRSRSPPPRAPPPTCSTPLNDKFETLAYKRVFGDHAPKIKISSTKGATGHLLGAAGGVEAAIVCKAIQTGVAPPTINYVTPDPECDLDYVPNVAHTFDSPLEVAITDNLGFGGHNAALVFKRYSGEGKTRAPDA